LRGGRRGAEQRDGEHGERERERQVVRSSAAVTVLRAAHANPAQGYRRGVRRGGADDNAGRLREE
jgi:hypothetical protein